MSDVANFGIQAALAVMIMLVIISTYRIWVGPAPADRLQALDTLTTLLVGVIVLLALIEGSVFVIDVGIALAAFGFVATLAIARYIADGKLF
jgi:multicomponent Na+:H+ antiporter subunit F